MAVEKSRRPEIQLVIVTVNNLQGEMMRENDILPIDIQQAVHGIGWTSTGAREFSQVLLYSDQPEAPTRRDDSKWFLMQFKLDRTIISIAPGVKKLCELSFVILLRKGSGEIASST
ncbi:hypothetical protein F4814DRAFT_210325 [Daldinia grandis]|nr:hypothetical protein F4814DRAFT_210325 [Daldinia grandis]